MWITLSRFALLSATSESRLRSYDGSVSVTGGRLVRLEGWRFFQADAVSGESSWKLEIKRVPFENQPDKPNKVAGNSGPTLNVVPAGVVVTADASSSSIEFRTAQGTFSVPVREVVWGKHLAYLDGDAVVERVPTAFRVSPDNAEQHDYPSLAVTRQGEAWTAWQAYQDRGDHVYARAGSGDPMRLTAEKADIYRTAVGEDARGHIHVAWSERNGEEWQIHERVWDGRAWGARRQITRGTSPNIFHRMVSAGAGPLRMVWVGHENGESWLYMAAFDGAAWSAPATHRRAERVESRRRRRPPRQPLRRLGQLPGGQLRYLPAAHPGLRRAGQDGAGHRVRRGSRRTLRSPSTAKTAYGSPGTNPAPTGARTGATTTRTAARCSMPTVPL